MNNGKVRIYDLAKELKLDNKVVLEICDQKQIQYKSHSSTISETEAELIRSAAEKLPPSVTQPTITNPRPNGGSRSAPPAPPVKPQRTQQILEIRHRPPTPNVAATPPRPPVEVRQGPLAPASPSNAAPRPPLRTPETVSASSAGADAAVTHSSTPVGATPARPSSPHSVANPDTSATASATTVTPSRPSPTAPVATPATVVTTTTATTATTATTDSPTADTAAPARSATTPPQRPAAAQPGRSATPAQASPPVNRPTVIRATAPKDDSAANPVAASSATREREVGNREADRGEAARPASLLQKPQLRQSRSDGASPAGQGPSSRPSGPGAATGRTERGEPVPRSPEVQLQPPPRLQPPPTRTLDKPARPGASASGQPKAGEADTIEVLQNLSLSKFPGRGGTAKKAKTKQQEEEELQEELLKANKAAAGKVKRRPQTNLDDEEDVDFALDHNAQNMVDVSQSLVRPPKPKSLKQAKPAAIATTRISASKPSRKSSRSGRDRRQQEEVNEKPEIISLTGDLTVQELAAKLAVEASEVIRTLFFKGIAATINQMLDQETATMVAGELGVEVIAEAEASAARKVTEMLEADDLENLQRRPPVVTIMGHVDHGKTTLLDSIRQAKVAQGEAGGITQHIGAYHVNVEHNGEMEQVVFLDTPGHEAFTAMRARGARVTDIAILVVAADDGVRPQTIEAISHAKAAEVPIVVAINKIDKPSAQPDRVKQELTEHGLVAEEWGGDTIMVPVSAINRENLDTLLEMILLVSEVEDLYANPDRPAKGTVIEAHLDKARGAVATLLVQNGTLRVGDILVAGSAIGKVRAMIDDRGKRVDVASPSFAVEVLGLGEVPAAGDEFEVFTDEREARAIATQRADEQRQSRLQAALSSRRVSLTGLSDQAREGDLKELNLILKADVQGSVEAILNALGQLPQNEVQVRVLFAAPGEVTETDVDLAAASSAVIIGFNTTLATGARQSADRTGVDIREYNIIYKLLDDIQGAMEGLLEPEMVEEDLGQAQVRAVFPVGKGSVAGCYVQNGKLVRNCKVRIHRGSQVIHSGALNSLKRIKEDAREVNAGYECGVRLDDFQDWAEGDIIEAFQLVTKRRTLSPA